MGSTHTPNVEPPVYAGVGARKTPADVLRLMERVAFRLAVRGWVLNTGGAPGADDAWERGARQARSPLPCCVDLWLPTQGWRGKRGHSPALDGGTRASYWGHAERLAREVHPRWEGLSLFGQRAHARNVMIVLGSFWDGSDADNARRARRVLCWTPGGEPVGGTRTAIVVAERFDIPVVNLARPGDRRRVEAWLAEP